MSSSDSQKWLTREKSITLVTPIWKRSGEPSDVQRTSIRLIIFLKICFQDLFIMTMNLLDWQWSEVRKQLQAFDTRDWLWEARIRTVLLRTLWVSFPSIPFDTLQSVCQVKSNFYRKHFISGTAFETHIRSKPHKRRLHALKTEPYTIEESEVHMKFAFLQCLTFSLILILIPLSVPQEWGVTLRQSKGKWKLYCQMQWSQEKT